MSLEFYITFHAVERLQERFPLFCKQFPELCSWKRPNNPNNLLTLFKNFIAESTENKSYLNNSANMIKMYEKYGYDNDYSFLEHNKEGILFILSKKRKENTYALLTVMPSSFRNLSKSKSYNKIESKKEKTKKEMLQWFEDLTKKTVTPNTDFIKTEKIFIPGTDYNDEIIKELILKVAACQTQFIQKISNTKTHHLCTINEITYEFICSKHKNGSRAITFEKIIKNEKNTQDSTPKTSKKFNSI
jgi:hypothetical protein